MNEENKKQQEEKKPRKAAGAATGLPRKAADAATGSDEKDKDKRPIKVELRSDVLTSIKEAAKTGRKWWLIGGAIVLLLVVVALVVWRLPGREIRVQNDEGDNFGNLPAADDRKLRGVSESGLSGMRCEGGNRRAIAVMLAGDAITRPISGFSAADMVWELPVLVSDVTRLMAVYQCGRPEDIGSIRSARHDYLFLAEGADAIVGHWGGSYHALNRIAAGEFMTINALTNPFGAFFRKGPLSAPYNGFTTYDNLWTALEGLEYRTVTEFEGYKFKDDIKEEDRPAAGKLSVGWPGAYRVSYEYDRATNRYQRFWGGTKQIDGGDKRDVAPSAVVIMRAGNSFADGAGGYNDVDVEGEGALEVYQDGEVIKGTWEKNVLYKSDPVHFLDERGKEIKLVRGQVWVMVVEPEIDVSWEITESTGESAEPSPQP